MGANDYHIDLTGQMRSGGLEAGVVELERIQAEAAKQLQILKDRELPMLKGKGFIVIDPKNPRFDGEEHDTLESAQDSGSNVAYQSGTAIVYAPVLVMKPQRPTANTVPSALLTQLGLPSGAKVGEQPAAISAAAPAAE